MTDFVQDLEAELLAAARRRATRRPRPRIAWRRITVAAAAVALLAAAALTHRPSEQPATPKPGAFIPPLVTPIRACAAAKPTYSAIRGKPPQALMRELAVLRRPYQLSDQLIVPAPRLQRWLPVGAYNPQAVRAASVPATYLVPTGDLRTKPLDCGGGRSRGPGVCLVMPADFACFTLGEIREGRAFARNGVHLLGLVPDGVHWVRLGDIAALVDGNAVHVVGKVWPFRVAFEHAVPRVAILNATATPALATGLADRLEPVLGRRPQVGTATRLLATTAVIAKRPQDAMPAQAIGTWIGASMIGHPSQLDDFGAPDDADIVVVLGERMR